MALYINQTGKLKEVKEKPFKLEKDIQKVFEANLPVVMPGNMLSILFGNIDLCIFWQ